jgi:hypothetical protein
MAADTLQRYCIAVGYIAGSYVVIIAIVGSALISWTDHLPSTLPSLVFAGESSHQHLSLVIGFAALIATGYLIARAGGSVSIVTACAIAAFAATTVEVSPLLALGSTMVGAGAREIETHDIGGRGRALWFAALGGGNALIWQYMG